MKSANEVTSGSRVPEAWAPLLEVAIREVFEIMLGSKLEMPGKDQVPATCDFTAMVGLAGQLCGLLTVRCGTVSAIAMTSKMLGVDAEHAEEHIWDALGEISNMIAGNFKNKLTGMADRCMLSVPTVVTGGDYSFRTLADGDPLEITMLFEGQPVAVALEVHS